MDSDGQATVMGRSVVRPRSAGHPTSSPGQAGCQQSRRGGGERTVTDRAPPGEFFERQDHDVQFRNMRPTACRFS
jgi:hypothetical protein